MVLNPKDIFENKEAISHYESIAKSIADNNGIAVMSNFVIYRNYNFLSKESLPYTNAYGKVVGHTLNLFNIIDINNLLKSFQIEQINFLKQNPSYLKRELQISLSVSSLLLNEHFRRNEVVKGKSIWKLLWKGGEKMWKERIDRRKEEMIAVLAEPICLLFNAYYINNNQELYIFDNILRDFISCSAWDNDELCLYTFPSFMNQDLKSFFKMHFEDLIHHAETNKDSFPSLPSILNKCKNIYQERIKELDSIENERYSFYRDQIEEWTKQFPASEHSSNYSFVIASFESYNQHCPIKISLDSSINELLQVHSVKRELLIETFAKTKHYNIPYYYMLIFKTIGEIVSYWNAYDSNKNEELEMDL